MFEAIRDDETEHVDTMNACLDPQVVVSNRLAERAALGGAALLVGGVFAAGNLDVGDLLDEDSAGALLGGAAGLLEQADGLFRGGGADGLEDALFDGGGEEIDGVGLLLDRLAKIFERFL